MFIQYPSHIFTCITKTVKPAARSHGRSRVTLYDRMIRRKGKSERNTFRRHVPEKRGAYGASDESSASRPDGGRRGGNSASSARCVSGGWSEPL